MIIACQTPIVEDIKLLPISLCKTEIVRRFLRRILLQEMAKLDLIVIL